MEKLLQVKEYDTIMCNENYIGSPCFKYLERRYFDELKQFVETYTTDSTDILEFMRIGFKRSVGETITLNNYVGIIELPSGFQIEILPKTTLGETDGSVAETKSIFLNMLRCLKEFDGKAFGSASLNADKMNLYEVFIKMYIKEAQNLVKHGLKSGYIANEENLRFYKGKLQVSQHIKANLAHKERFFMKYDEYQLNRAENKLVKTTLLKLQGLTRSSDSAREIRQLLTYFELVDVSTNIDKDFGQISIGRDTKDYERLIQWAEIFLRNKSFTTFSGKDSGQAILFPMEKVFEAFVAKWVKHIFTEKSAGVMQVSAQDGGYYLFDQPRKFRLRPDIVVKEQDMCPVIMDTKWKRLKPDSGINYGISQADMYQMYAYSKKYHTPSIWLLYPLNDDVRAIENLSFQAVKDEDMLVNVHVFFIDLANYQESLETLYERIMQEQSSKVNILME